MEQEKTRGFTIDFHFKFNVDTPKALYEHHFPSYVGALEKAGASRAVIHRPKKIGAKARQALGEMVSCLHSAGLKAVLYTGVFGQENVVANPSLALFAQRNKQGKLLSYMSGQEKSAMICPASPYAPEYLAPKVLETLKAAEFDSLFLDIPWIMRGGCYCANCSDMRDRGADNKRLVRYGLENFVNSIKRENPSIPIGINSSAPGIYLHAWHGAEIDNFKGLFQEYITEWNPYHWKQKPSVVTDCIKKAREKAEGEFYHATVCKDTQGRIYSKEKVGSLFSAILEGGALPWLCVNASEEQLGKIGAAWHDALERIALS